MKKFLATALAVCMTVSLAACGSSAQGTTTTSEAAPEASSVAATTEAASDAAPESTAAAETTAAAEGAVASVDDLPGKSIGVQLGTTGDIFASDYEEQGSTIERFNKGNDAIQALLQGKIDCVMIDEQPAKAFVANTTGLKILEEPFAEEDYAICVSKDNADLTASINEALAKLKADGTLDNIIKNYIGDDTKGQFPYESPADVDRSKGTLVMATNAYFEPYEFYQGDKVVGIDADMAQAVCDVLGYELKIEDMEFDSIINAIQSGKADIGVAGITVTEDRLQSVDFTDSYASSKQVIIVKE
ncbi:transporter substrate-binding domain-containing protein [Eisenbergiella sp.]